MTADSMVILSDVFDYWNNRQAELEIDYSEDDETMTKNYLETFEID